MRIFSSLMVNVCLCSVAASSKDMDNVACRSLPFLACRCLKPLPNSCSKKSLKPLSLPALCDSGNLLRDPISARPVIPIDAVQSKSIIPEAILTCARAERLTDAVAALPPELARRVRLIPAKSVLNTHATLLLAWQPEQLALLQRKSLRPISAYLAPLPLDTAQKGFYAIISSELIQ